MMHKKQLHMKDRIFDLKVSEQSKVENIFQLIHRPVDDVHLFIHLVYLQTTSRWHLGTMLTASHICCVDFLAGCIHRRWLYRVDAVQWKHTLLHAENKMYSKITHRRLGMTPMLALNITQLFPCCMSITNDIYIRNQC